MRIIIGIYQNRAAAVDFFCSREIEAESIVEVGPFFSKDQALSWMQCLRNKIKRSEEASLPRLPESDEPWYGFTGELRDYVK